ncbi:MAG: FtsH protease activity modulator HflK [Gammaproteobacteria bacterium]|nr:FtsH protease activity modulator HflK [Gammaproteobacteria bacterium]MDH5800723.1 FtsH protease activity modulator HflK [Gammaproteobacteria bacterium]
MAWNEPGGSGKKDPWGNGGGDQGPPDLDEVVKKMQEKFGALFGGGKGRGQSGSSSGKGGSIGLGAIILLAAAIWGASGIYIIDEGRRGVVLQFGAYKETTLPGPHWFPRFIQSVEVVDIQNIRSATIGYRSGSGSGSGSGSSRQSNIGRESLMLTKDENIVDIKMAVQYKVKSASDYLFKVTEPDITLRQATESAVREIIGGNNMDFVLTEGRTEIASKAHALTQEILDRYNTGLEITSVNMQDAQPPEQVQAAFEDAVKAREDNVRAINKAQAHANEVLPKARGNAAVLVAEAKAYRDKVILEAQGEANRFLKILEEYKRAPQVTRKRLYLESVETVMTNATKIMVDVKGGNNLMYLPLDRLMDQNVRSQISQTPVIVEEEPVKVERRRERRRRGER